MNAGLAILADEPDIDSAALSALDEQHGHEHAADQTAVVRPFYFDFGAVPDGDVVLHTFRLWNSDQLPLTITRMSPSCGCTVPAIRYIDRDGSLVRGRPSDEPEILVIPPGAEVELDIRIDTSSVKTKNVTKLMQVRVTTDSQNDPFLTLECSILVEQAFYISGEFVSLGSMPKSIGGQGTTEISEIGDSGARLVSVGSTPPGVSARLERKPIIGRAVWDLNVSVDAPLELGIYSRQIELLTETAEGKQRPALFVDLRGSVVPDIRVTPARFFFQGFQSDGVSTIAADVSTLIPGAKFKITAIEKTGEMRDQIDVEWFPRDNPADTSAANWTVKATASPAIAVERFSGTFEIITDDPQTPRITVVYVGL